MGGRKGQVRSGSCAVRSAAGPELGGYPPSVARRPAPRAARLRVLSRWLGVVVIMCR